MTERFSIERARWVRPLLAVFGATDENAWVEIYDDRIEARFGWYYLVMPRENIASVALADWPWWSGAGWRTNFKDTLGLIGGLKNPVVQITLKKPQAIRLLKFPIRMKHLYLSVESPATFVESLMPEPQDV